MSIATSAPLSALMFAAFATLVVAGCGVNVRLADDATRRIENDIVAVDSLSSLELVTDNGAVEIRGGGGNEIAVRTVLQERHEGDAEYSIDVDGDGLVVTGECDARWWDHCSVGFIVTVPSDFDIDSSAGRQVSARSDNGAIDVEYRTS